MFSDPIFKLITDTLRANDKIIMDGQYDVDGGETFRVSFVAKSPAPNNQADIDLSAVFASFPEGFAVQRIANLNHTMVRLPVALGEQREECRGTFVLTVTKANWLKGQDGHQDDPGKPGTQGPAGELSIDDILEKYRKLPENKQRQFVNAAKLLLKGLAL